MKFLGLIIVSTLLMNVATATDLSKMVWPKAKNEAHIFSHFDKSQEKNSKICNFPKVEGKTHAFFHKHLGYFNICPLDAGKSVMLQFKNDYKGEICFYPSIQNGNKIKTYKQKTCLNKVEAQKIYKVAFSKTTNDKALAGLMMMRNQSHYFAPPFDSTLQTVEAFSKCLNAKTVMVRGKAVSPVCNAFSVSGHFAFHNFVHHQKTMKQMKHKKMINQLNQQIPLQGKAKFRNQNGQFIRLNKFEI